jgi:hypothetical protein
MKKVWEIIKTWFVEFGADVAIDKGGDFLEEALNKFYVKSPKMCAAMVSSMYVWVDTIVEDLAATTNTEIDDDGVDEVKEQFEKFAFAKGFTLTNLDAD